MAESYLGRLLLWTGVVLLVVLIYARETSPASAWGPEDWSALATIFIALVLLLAVLIAAFELHDVRELRRGCPTCLGPEPTAESHGRHW